MITHQRSPPWLKKSKSPLRSHGIPRVANRQKTAPRVAHVVADRPALERVHLRAGRLLRVARLRVRSPAAAGSRAAVGSPAGRPGRRRLLPRAAALLGRRLLHGGIGGIGWAGVGGRPGASGVGYAGAAGGCRRCGRGRELRGRRAGLGRVLGQHGATYGQVGRVQRSRLGWARRRPVRRPSRARTSRRRRRPRCSCRSVRRSWPCPISSDRGGLDSGNLYRRVPGDPGTRRGLGPRAGCSRCGRRRRTLRVRPVAPCAFAGTCCAPAVSGRSSGRPGWSSWCCAGPRRAPSRRPTLVDGIRLIRSGAVSSVAPTWVAPLLLVLPVTGLLLVGLAMLDGSGRGGDAGRARVLGLLLVGALGVVPRRGGAGPSRPRRLDRGVRRPARDRGLRPRPPRVPAGRARPEERPDDQPVLRRLRHPSVRARPALLPVLRRRPRRAAAARTTTRAPAAPAPPEPARLGPADDRAAARVRRAGQEPCGRRPRLGKVLGIGAIVLALGGAGFVGWQVLGPKGGSGSPEEAVQGFVDAVGAQDGVGLLDVIAPGEVEGLDKVYKSAQDRLEEEGLTDGSSITDAVSTRALRSRVRRRGARRPAGAGVARRRRLHRHLRPRPAPRPARLHRRDATRTPRRSPATSPRLCRSARRQPRRLRGLRRRPRSRSTAAGTSPSSAPLADLSCRGRRRGLRSPDFDVLDEELEPIAGSDPEEVVDNLVEADQRPDVDGVLANLPGRPRRRPAPLLAHDRRAAARQRRAAVRSRRTPSTSRRRTSATGCSR